MNSQRICSTCGKALATNAPGGLCPDCLIKVGLGTGVDIGPETESGAGHGAFVAPTVEEIAPLFPQLEIVELIGHGGMGAVYKARQRQLNRFVALKILPPGIGSAPAFAERFTREARALAQLNHPGIVTIYDFGITSSLQPSAANPQPLYYFLMEYMDGVNLRQLMAAGRLAAREALAIVPQICDALQFAHDQGIVHRDIKPENILMDRRGRVKVADFGLAKIVAGGGAPPGQAGTEENQPAGTEAPASGLTEASKVMGTPQYMSPEQIQSPNGVDHRADIFALGVVFYEMLTGQLPVGKFAPPSACARGVQVDVRLDEVVLRALEKEPERRYQQASEVKTAVEIIASTPRLLPKTSWLRKHSRPVVTIAVSLLMLLAAAAFFFQPSKLRAPLEHAPQSSAPSAAPLNTQTAEPPLQVSRPGTNDLSKEFAVLKRMENWVLRDIRLVEFAKEAARAGDAKMVELSLETLVATNFRDDAAMVCARLLAKAGKPADAREVAKSVAWPASRNYVLAQLNDLPPANPNPRRAEPPGQAPRPASSGLSKQFDQLKAMEDWSTRDLRLGQFAKEAARAGDGEMTQRALDTIIGAVTRDSAAGVCVRLLAKAGQLAAADEVARAITWPESRRLALEELNGSPEDPNSPLAKPRPPKQAAAPEGLLALVPKLPTNIVAALKTNDFEKAQSLAAEATRQKPEFSEAWIAQGLASVRLGHWEGAQQSYERALSLAQARSRANPSDAHSIFQQIVVLTLLNRPDEAHNQLDQARKSYPDDDQLTGFVRQFSEAEADLKNWTVKNE